MIRVTLLMSALFARASAHIYERCELARELTSLGVHRDHLATWVCIAYHESRFDTSARNHGSGDHGLFQISELYWCGPGKACGVPCTAFRDEDISDDLECALKIHKEHTLLQGDGYLAWVVYPLHCKHINAKKYLVDCEASIKNVTVLDSRSRSLKNNRIYTTPKPFDANYYAKGLPSFLAINSIFEGNQAKQFEDDQKIDWVNFKIDNIDNIKLPVVNNNELFKFVKPATTSTTPIVYDYEQNLRKNYKNDWVNYRFDNIDSLKLPSFSASPGNQQNSGQPNWLNIKINTRIDDIALPISNNNAVIKYVTPSTTPQTIVDFEENYLRKNLKHDWYNFKIDNIDDIKLPAFYKNDGQQRNNYNRGQFNWLNIKIDSRIDDIDLPTFSKQISIENSTPVTTTARTTTTIDPELIGIKPPMPRRIESNQFRRKMMLIIAMNDENKLINKNDELTNNINNKTISNVDPVVTTTPLPPNFSKNSQDDSTISTTTAKPTTYSWKNNNTSPTTPKPETTTRGIFSFNRIRQEQFTFKPFTLSTQKSVTNRPFNWSFNLPTLKPIIINTPKTLPYEGRINVSESNLPLASSTTARPWSWTSPQPSPSLNTPNQSLVDSLTTSSSNSWYKPSVSTVVFANKSESNQEKLNTQSISTTTSASNKRQRWSFNSFGSVFNRPFGQQLNTSQNVSQALLTSTITPFSAYKITAKSESTNTSSEPRKYSTYESYTIRPVQGNSSTVKPFSTIAKFSEYNTSSSVKPQVEQNPSENSPNDPTAKSTPSIFDLYLRPEKFKMFQQFKYSSFKPSSNKLTIFSGGTTSPSPNFLSVKP